MKNRRIVNFLIVIATIIAFAITFGKTYAKYILTKHIEADLSSSPFYFSAEISNPTITVQKKLDNTLYVNPTFDLVIKNNNGDKYNSYDVTYTVSIIDSSNIHFDNVPTKTITGESKKDEQVKIAFDISDLDNIPETVTIRVTTTKPYSKNIDLKFNLKDEWVIQKIEDLVTLSNNVNNGKNYSNEDFVLLNDLDFANPSDYENPNRVDYEDYNGDQQQEILIEELKKGRGFTPIGYIGGGNQEERDAKTFKGNFDGQEYTIKNLYIKNENEGYNAGLFGVIADATIKNLKLDGTITAEIFGAIGGLVGCAYYSEFDNCINYASVDVGEGRYQGAGIVASDYGSTITNCINYGDISEGNHTGGIVGIIGDSDSDVTRITGCHNYGTISNALGSTAMGGIVGHQSSAASDLAIIDNCYNYGTITADNNVKAEQKVGGIMGIVRGKAIITNCFNEGKVEGHLSKTTFSFNGGGIVGRVEAGHAIIRNCHNSGTIAGEYRMGGIVGHINSEGTIYVIDCHNEGVLQQVLINENPNSASGGILGYGNKVHVYLINSYNSGAINGHQAGGLIGAFSSDANDSAYVVNSYNAGGVNSTTNYAGGIFGHLNSASTFKVINVYNIGSVSGPSETYSYGIGYINTTGAHTITNVYYNEKHSPSNQEYGWTLKKEEEMRNPSFTEILAGNISSIDVTEMKSRLIDVGLADNNYDLHVHKWLFDATLGYPVLDKEHSDL